ncbi:MAG: S53 family peptidase [Acidobacteriota bacterium]|nr:S53 family peptidase [Acidobacteriota bacterium]
MIEQKGRIAIAGSRRRAARASRKSGAADPNKIIEVLLLLRHCQAGGKLPSSEELGARFPRQRHYLSRAEFAARHGADSDDIALIQAFAAERALQVTQTHVARRSITLKGTAAKLGAAFGVELACYEGPDGSFIAHDEEVSVPSWLASIVEGVFGLDTRPIARPHLRHSRISPQDTAAQDTAGSSAANTPYLTPPQVAERYNFPADANGDGQCIAIVELGGGYFDTDLQGYFEWLGLSEPSVTAVSVAGATNQPTGNKNSYDGEVMLDIEVAGAAAPGAHLAVYFAPNNERGFIEAVSTAIHDSDNHPSVLSISWGEDESFWSDSAMASFNQILSEAVALGVTVCASSGDYGSSDGVNDGAAHVSFPASSPYVLACGGTSLTDGGDNQNEVVWNDLAYGGGASGGGVSGAFPLPDYQQAADVPTSSTAPDKPGRGVPDVAGLADPQSAYLVRVDGLTTLIGGTSAVAPLWAALIARINQVLGQSLIAPVGYFNPLLYGQLTQAAVMQNITTGSNGVYQAQPGWDACTGLGTPNGVKLLDALNQPSSP